MSTFSALYGVGNVISSKLFVTLPIPTASSKLSEQTIVVTGANGGLGFETCVHLSKLGVGKLIMAVRSLSKGKDAKNTVIKISARPESSIDVWHLDMESFESVKAFAARVSGLPRLDGVMAGAGIMTSEWTLSENLEKTLNINVVSTFMLCFLLLPKMRESGQQTGNVCRFSIPNSALHYLAPLGELEPHSGSIIDRLNDPKKANMGGRYIVSKLLVLYAVREMAERCDSSGKSPVIINTPNPSFCKSNLANESQGSAGFRIFERLLARSSEEGSRVLVHGLFAGNDTNGQYLSNCKIETYAASLDARNLPTDLHAGLLVMSLGSGVDRCRKSSLTSFSQSLSLFSRELRLIFSGPRFSVTTQPSLPNIKLSYSS